MTKRIDARPLAEANEDVRPPGDDGPPPESGGGDALASAAPTPPDAPPGDAAPTTAEPVRRTPAAWAKELGHTDPEIKVDREFGPVLPKGVDHRKLRGWIFAAAAAHAGWGTKLPIDIELTRGEYERAVEAALSLPIGEAKTEQRLRAIEADRAKEATR